MRWRSNMGPADRLVRLVVGVSLIGFAALGLFPSAWAWLAGGIGAVVALTAVSGYCPLYHALGLGWKPGGPGNGGGAGG